MCTRRRVDAELRRPRVLDDMTGNHHVWVILHPLLELLAVDGRRDLQQLIRFWKRTEELDRSCHVSLALADVQGTIGVLHDLEEGPADLEHLGSRGREARPVVVDPLQDERRTIGPSRKQRVDLGVILLIDLRVLP